VQRSIAPDQAIGHINDTLMVIMSCQMLILLQGELCEGTLARRIRSFGAVAERGKLSHDTTNYEQAFFGNSVPH